MKRILLAVALGMGLGAASLAMPAAAQADEMPTAEEILAGIDRNMIFDTRYGKTRMIVEGTRRTRTFEMESWGRGQDDSAVEYLAPAREKGTRMLKKGDELWMYMPSVDRTQKISGHMLRQGMMGSDVSYEDMMASTELNDMYDAEVTGEGDVDGRPCWQLTLTAKDESVTYPKRVSWIDKELYIPLKQELYALSGMLLKTWVMTDIKEFENGRQFPTKMVISDEVKKGSKTTLEFNEIQFGVEVDNEIFSTRWLERK